MTITTVRTRRYEERFRIMLSNPFIACISLFCVQKGLGISNLALSLAALLLAGTLVSILTPGALASSNSGPGSSNSGPGGSGTPASLITPSQTPASIASSNSTSLNISEKPLAIGHYRTLSQNSLSNTTMQISVVGNTTISLPNSSETITTNDTGNATITFTQSGGAILQAQVFLKSKDGLENATITATEFFDSESSPGRGVALFSTNSTGKLAPLDGIVAITLDEDQLDGSTQVSFFEWQTGSMQNNQANVTDNNQTATTPPAASTGGEGKVSIIPGSTSKTQNAFDPNPVQVKVGDTVTWTNNDSTPHTVTSGSNGQPDGKFNSSPNLNPLLAPGQTFQHTFEQAGQYQYFCALHPNMVGTVSVS